MTKKFILALTILLLPLSNAWNYLHLASYRIPCKTSKQEMCIRIMAHNSFYNLKINIKNYLRFHVFKVRALEMLSTPYKSLSAVLSVFKKGVPVVSLCNIKPLCTLKWNVCFKCSYDHGMSRLSLKICIKLVVE